MSSPDPARTEPTEPAPLRSVCVYCASSTGTDPALAEAAVALGHLVADQGLELVYGGGSVGLMGLVADAVLERGGEVTGIIPLALMPREVAHEGVTRLIDVESMHARKARMIELSDAFIALPGGYGTLEELAEVLTWAQLGIHAKGIGLLNVGGFYDGLLAFFDRAIADGVLKPANRELLLDRRDPGELLDALRHYRPSYQPKWVDLDRRA
ncbi:MAG: TIGR00730 family Rossman fold protein [Actinomycetota bacterium]